MFSRKSTFALENARTRGKLRSVVNVLEKNVSEETIAFAEEVRSRVRRKPQNYARRERPLKRLHPVMDG